MNFSSFHLPALSFRLSDDRSKLLFPIVGAIGLQWHRLLVEVSEESLRYDTHDSPLQKHIVFILKRRDGSSVCPAPAIILILCFAFFPVATTSEIHHVHHIIHPSHFALHYPRSYTSPHFCLSLVPAKKMTSLPTAPVSSRHVTDPLPACPNPTTPYPPILPAATAADLQSFYVPPNTQRDIDRKVGATALDVIKRKNKESQGIKGASLSPTIQEAQICDKYSTQGMLDESTAITGQGNDGATDNLIICASSVPITGQNSTQDTLEESPAISGLGNAGAADNVTTCTDAVPTTQSQIPALLATAQNIPYFGNDFGLLWNLQQQQQQHQLPLFPNLVMCGGTQGFPSPLAYQQQQYQQQYQQQHQQQLQFQQTQTNLPVPSPVPLPVHHLGERTKTPLGLSSFCKTEPFPEKLHRLLMEAEASGKTDIISWLPNGRGFCIHKTDRFLQEIGSHYFRQSRFSSFKRQLSLYGFSQLKNSMDHSTYSAGSSSNHCYSHALFQRDAPDLCRKMRRVSTSTSTHATNSK